MASSDKPNTPLPTTMALPQVPVSVTGIRQQTAPGSGVQQTGQTILWPATAASGSQQFNTFQRPRAPVARPTMAIAGATRLPMAASSSSNPPQQVKTIIIPSQQRGGQPQTVVVQQQQQPDLATTSVNTPLPNNFQLPSVPVPISHQDIAKMQQRTTPSPASSTSSIGDAVKQEPLEVQQPSIEAGGKVVLQVRESYLQHQPEDQI